VNFAEGMDHARMGNSSERPGEDGNIERLFAEGEMLRLCVYKVDFFRQVGGTVDAGDA
jgi:hypothetical protein